MLRIGLDFDNTLAGYDAVFGAAAKAAGVVEDGFTGGKAEVRTHCRALPEGETAWMRLQGRVYGAHMAEAELIEGVDGFLSACRDSGAEVFVVSHKTEFGHFDPDRVNLRDAALGWMEAKGFFTGYGLGREAVSFHATRADKVARITTLGLDHFVDDLEEVFEEPGFPAATMPHLFIDGRASDGRFNPFRRWSALTSELFPR